MQPQCVCLVCSSVLSFCDLRTNHQHLCREAAGHSKMCWVTGGLGHFPTPGDLHLMCSCPRRGIFSPSQWICTHALEAGPVVQYGRRPFGACSGFSACGFWPLLRLRIPGLMDACVAQVSASMFSQLTPSVHPLLYPNSLLLIRTLTNPVPTSSQLDCITRTQGLIRTHHSCHELRFKSIFLVGVIRLLDPGEKTQFYQPGTSPVIQCSYLRHHYMKSLALDLREMFMREARVSHLLEPIF